MTRPQGDYERSPERRRTNGESSRKANVVLLDEHFTGGLAHYRAQLKGMSVVAMKLDIFYQQGGAAVQHVRGGFEKLQESLRRFPESAIILVPDWKHYRNTKLLESLRRIPSKENRPPLILFDTFDQTSSPFLSATEYVDGYFKSQVYSNVADYSRAYQGAYMVSDWVHRHLGTELAEWSFGSQIPAGCESKLHCGWNMGVSRFYKYLLRLSRLYGHVWKKRSVFLNCRFTLPERDRVQKWEWYHDYRRFCGLEATKLRDRFCLTGNQPLGRISYIRELWNSRVVFSPFGWGEVCFRDFEAVVCGAVLLKPDMSHLRTEPNIYENWVTYVPVNWDLSNLEERCQWILDHPAESELMIENARNRLLSYRIDLAAVISAAQNGQCQNVRVENL
jgi:hypothetical protein